MNSKLKKIKKLLFPSSFALITLALSSCTPSISTVGVGVYKLWAKYNDLSSYISKEPSSALKWMSQREISLAFVLRDKNTNKSLYEFGTAWIFAKDTSSTNNGFTYYLATNIHVLSNLNSLNRTTTRYQMYENGKTSEISQYNLDGVYFNFINDDNISSVYTNNDDSMKYLWVDGSRIESSYIKLDTSKVSIAYTATGDNLVSNSTSLYVDPFTNKQVTNPAIDFGLIKIDFSDVKSSTNKSSTSSTGITVEQFLQTYDSNPTKFNSSNEIDYNDTFYISGFPEDSTSWKPNKNTAWLGLTNIKLTEENEYMGLAYNNYVEFADLSSPTSPMPLIGGIDYVTQKDDTDNTIDANWYRNVGKELIIGAGDLGGGASGSMFVSQNSNGEFAVEGIYWGVYEYSVPSGIKYSYGVVDLLQADSYSYSLKHKGIEYNYVFPSYNVLSSAASKLNLSLPYISN